MEELHSCRCCLRGAPDKDLTTPYTHLGRTEIYSDMLKDCFDILMSLDDADCGICWVCVDRLRDATDFKLQVQRCQGELLALKGEGHVKDVPVIKSENDVTMEDDKVLEVSYDRDKEKLETEDKDDTENKDETSEVPVVKSEQPDGDVEMADDEDSPTGADADEDDPASEAEADDVANDEDFLPDSDHEESDVGSAGSGEVVGAAGDEDPSGPVDDDSVAPRVSRSRKRSADGREQPQMVLVQTSSTATDARQKSTRIRTKDFCFFCETEVLNFARHVFRNYSMESDVQKILSYPKKSCIRKNLLTNLRKKGNYLANVSKCVKPMKKSELHNDYLPCKNCLGYYSRKQLWKHKKTCHTMSETHSQVIAQNFMLRNLNVDKKLKEEVLCKIRPDRVSLEAKKDPLICEFGARFVRMHRNENDEAEYDDTIPDKELASDLNADEDDLPLSNVSNANTPSTPVIVVTTKKKRNIVPWTSEQKEIVMAFFSKHIKTKCPPKRHQCDELRALYPDVLRNKDWLKIKVFVQNIYTKKS